MTWLTCVAVGVLASLSAALLRVWHGPGRADRMMGAQLAGTSGVAVLVVLAPLEGWAALDVALILALFGALAAVGFVKAVSADGGGDPEEDEDLAATPSANGVSSE
ncbi:monovalent cation/H+ antiporter complex subunit F [Marivita sp.]|uniref:monovalent cation/H+ antiporter complex subunit F n=1 Tax=Marivita sp. TaxID=2003365 RepID=UPI0025C7353A|nr:monovalent cation/H+ antiporter complex subunit F [Marivita sp.]